MISISSKYAACFAPDTGSGGGLVRSGPDEIDLLAGAGSIAEYLFGNPRDRRKVYALHEKGELPIFKLGEILHARKSVLRRSLEEKEAAATGKGRAA